MNITKTLKKVKQEKKSRQLLHRTYHSISPHIISYRLCVCKMSTVEDIIGFRVVNKI